MKTSPATTYYVAVGASESLGVQPVPGRPHGAPTDEGYANALLATERSRWPGLELAHFGCSGISAYAALHGGGPCSFAAGTEVAAAADFLRAHRGRTVLVTVDLGFNDVWPCLARSTVHPRCVTAALARVSRALPVVLRELRAAGGPGMKIVGLLHNDPALAAYLRGTRGRAFSAAALPVMDRLNATLRTVYARAGVFVANVPAAFSIGRTAPARSGPYGRVPLEVAKVCALSWMCRMHNLHPNGAGYRAIAGAVAAALGATPGRTTGAADRRTRAQ